MEIPKDIQLLIKEYSMPIYKKPLHYKAYTGVFNNYSLKDGIIPTHPQLWMWILILCNIHPIVHVHPIVHLHPVIQVIR